MLMVVGVYFIFLSGGPGEEGENIPEPGEGGLCVAEVTGTAISKPYSSVVNSNESPGCV